MLYTFSYTIQRVIQSTRVLRDFYKAPCILSKDDTTKMYKTKTQYSEKNLTLSYSVVTNKSISSSSESKFEDKKFCSERFSL